MPHSETTDTPIITTTNTMSQVNGETPASAFLNACLPLAPSQAPNEANICQQHLYTYPVFSDTVSTVKSHPIAQKSIDLSHTGYEKIGKPVVPYLQKPYNTISPYVVPYVKKADSIGDSTLSTIDSKFPYVKKPTGEIYDQGKSVVFFPLRKALESKDYVFKTYNSEVKNVGAEGVVGYGKAALATGLVVSSDVLNWLGGFLSKKKAETKEVVNEKMNH